MTQCSVFHRVGHVPQSDLLLAHCAARCAAMPFGAQPCIYSPFTSPCAPQAMSRGRQSSRKAQPQQQAQQQAPADGKSAVARKAAGQKLASAVATATGKDDGPAYFSSKGV